MWTSVTRARILADQAQKREDKFRDSWVAESQKEDVLNRKFEEALKKAKDQPVEKPCAISICNILGFSLRIFVLARASPAS